MRQYFENGLTVLVVPQENLGPKAKTGVLGVQQSEFGKYWVRVSGRYLGIYETLEEAAAVSEEAIRQRAAGTFDAWAAELRKQLKTRDK